MENPEFRKVVFELDAQYAALDKALTLSFREESQVI